MKIFFENYWKIFKNNYYQSLQKQRKIRKLSLKEIQNIQWNRLKKLLEYVYDNNKFYRDYFESVNLTPNHIKQPEDMLKLPITEKKTYRKYFQKIISKDATKNNYSISCTSGSTGEPFEFYIDNKEDFHITPAFILNKEAMGINPFKKSSEIIIKCEPKNIVKDLKRGVKRSWSNYLRNIFFSQSIGINARDIKPENINDIIRIITENKIKSIYGFSSSILILAGYLSKYQKNVHLKYIITIGEGLLKQQREIISKAFHCPVYLDYGASECMRMGFECKYQNGYHMDIYNYYIEWLKNGRYAKNNELGEIIVTNLNNYVFPFIRYKLGDSAVFTNQTCRCGINLPMVNKIGGRITDIIMTPNKKELSGLFFADLFERLSKFVRQYQVIQIEHDELLIKICPTEMIDREKLKEIENYIYDLTDKSMKIRVVLVDEIASGESGKKRVVIPKEEYQKIKNKEGLY